MKKLPSKDEILKWVEDNPTLGSKRDIARAFGIRGALRTDLKKLLRSMSDEGLLAKRRRSYRGAGELPPVTVVRVLAPDPDGDLFAEALELDDGQASPRILIVPGRKDPALGEGDRILARLAKSTQTDITYEARIIRRIGRGAEKLLGIYRTNSEGARIVPVDKKQRKEWSVPPGETAGAKDGELVEAVLIGGRPHLGLPRARVSERLGNPMDAKSVSLVAIHQHGIPDEFPEATLQEAEQAKPVALGQRLDLRDLPLFTIDPSDARDHDDAICALPDDDPKNDGGWIVWVAIADVAHYVRPGSALDKEARNRGNSTYFPDRVVPMLPDELSGDLCSLHEGVDRPCMAVKMILNSAGAKIGHSFHRAMMRSPASLAYEQAQAADEGRHDEMTEPLAEPLKHLFAAFRTALKERARRQPLHLDLPERKIILSDQGKVLSIAFRERFDAHKLVEEFMVLANVCAAETLEAKRRRLLYRVHEEPPIEKLDALRDVAKGAGLPFAKGQVLKTAILNKLLDAANNSDDQELVNMAVLRSMTQAYYAPDNYGHFGLNLKRYAHFTSPIRRYADLIVHRALIAAHGWGGDGLSDADEANLAETGDWISQTERRSMVAERDTNDRYLASFLSERIGESFSGRISGIAKFGLFVKLDETGADGIIPLSGLGNEYWRYDPKSATLKGEKSKTVIAQGMIVQVKLTEAAPVTGGLTLQLVNLNGHKLTSGGSKVSTRQKHKGKRKSRRS